MCRASGAIHEFRDPPFSDDSGSLTRALVSFGEAKIEIDIHAISIPRFSVTHREPTKTGMALAFGS
jgi:hypothetical protein